MSMTLEEAEEMFARASLMLPAVPVRPMRGLAQNARERTMASWPSDTGESARGFTVVTRPDGAKLFNDVPHAFYVGEGLAHEQIQKSLSSDERPTVSRIDRTVTNLLEG